MKGKVFKNSSGVEQDQAKILYDYYIDAAKRIVSEEERIEKQAQELQDERAEIETKMSSLWVWFLTIILFFMYFVKKNQMTKRIEEIDEEIGRLKNEYDNIFRGYGVTKLGVAYVPVAEEIKYNDRSFMVDYTFQIPESQVKVQMSRKPGLLVETITKLDELGAEAPLVETDENVEAVDTSEYSPSIQQVQVYDYMGAMENALRTVSNCMQDVDVSSVSLPLVADGSEYLRHIEEYATDQLPDTAPIIEIFDSERYAASIDKFKELNRLKDSFAAKALQFEDVLRSLIDTLATSVDALARLKEASVDKMTDESNTLLFNVLKAPYNHYSPVLEREEIERIRQEKFDYSDNAQGYDPFNLKQSSRVKLDPLTGSWVAEDGSTTGSPFAVHQVFEEIVAPVVQNLMMENRIERLKIYNHIQDQKIEYLNRWHQDTEAFYRSNHAESADIINLMQEALRNYVAAYTTLVSMQRTEESMKQSDGQLDATVVNAISASSESMDAFQSQSDEFQAVQLEFENFMSELKDDIDRRAEEFGHVEFYDAKLRDGYANEAAVASAEVDTLDERRRHLASVNPYFAKKAELPPQPELADKAYEHSDIDLPGLAAEVLRK